MKEKRLEFSAPSLLHLMQSKPGLWLPDGEINPNKHAGYTTPVTCRVPKDSVNPSSTQVTPRHLSAPHLRNPAVISKQNTKTLNIITGIPDFVQTTRTPHCSCPSQTLEIQHTSATCAQTNPCLRPTSHTPTQCSFNLHR